MTLAPLLRVALRSLLAWQAQAVLLSATIVLLLVCLGNQENPHELLLRLERQRHEAELAEAWDRPPAVGTEEPGRTRTGSRIIRETGESLRLDAKEPEAKALETYPRPEYDVLVGVERAFGLLYRDVPRLFYNRIPKTGSRSLLRMVKQISKMNGFQLVESKLYLNYSITPEQEADLVRNVTRSSGPILFERHLYFIDFTRHHAAEAPVYISIVSDPATRLASWYYFIRFNRGHIRAMPQEDRLRTFDECVQLELDECVSTEKTFQIVPFFCGQQQFCRFPSRAALQQAKRHVELHYAAVGVLRDFKAFLSVLELLLPTYFANIVQLYENREAGERRYSRTVNKREPSSYTRALLARKLKYEYEFYHYAQQRFYRLLFLVNKARSRQMERLSPEELERRTRDHAPS